MDSLDIIIIILVIAIIAVYGATVLSQNPRQSLPLKDYSLAHNETQNRIEPFALPQADLDTVLTKIRASGADALDTTQKNQIKTVLGCSTDAEKRFSGYRSVTSGATFKFELVPQTQNKYYLYARNNLIVTTDTDTGAMSLALKGKAGQELERKLVAQSDNAAQKQYYFVIPVMGKNYALQYEHESIILRPLDLTDKPYPGQTFYEDTTLTDVQLNANAISLGYKVAPRIGGFELQNLSGTDTTPTPTAPGGDVNLHAMTQENLEKALTAALSNIGQFKQQTGNQQPGTSNNPFASKQLKVNVNLGGLGTTSPSGAAGASGLVSGFANIPSTHKESFADLAGNSGMSNVRDLLAAWDKSQGLPSDEPLGGIPDSSQKLGTALRGKLVSCPVLDRTQYYTERQLSQCTGCTPDPYLRGQLGGNIYV